MTPTLDLSEDVAVVTGGAQGIGYGIADALAAHGAAVAVADVNGEGAESAAAELESTHDPPALAVECDVTDEAEVEALVETTAAELGHPTAFVNNAGGASGFGRVWETDEADWDATLEVCLKGTFLGTKHAIGHMLDHGIEGAVVNVSSLNGEAATGGMSHYCAAKAGVSQLTEVAATEAGRHGVRVNAVAPGSIRTPMTEGNMFLEGEMGEQFRERTPLGRIGEPADVARVATFLVSDYARWVTGVTVPVDGGQHVRGLHDYYDTIVSMVDEVPE